MGLLALLTLVGAAPASGADDLQQRVDALAQQIHFRYRHHAPSLLERRAAVAEALDRWNDADTSGEAGDENLLRMGAWLDRALAAVMPGGSGAIPSPPEFIEEIVIPPALPLAVEPRLVQSEPEGERVDVAPEPIAPPPAAGTARVETASPPPAPVAPAPVAPTQSAAARSRFVGPRATRTVVAKPVTPPSPVPASPAAATPTTPPPVSRSKWSRHPSAAPLEWTDPFKTDPEASPNPLRGGTPRAARRPSFDTGSVRIDVRLLEAEVRGYNAALRSLHAAVLTLGEGDLAPLAAATDELEQLAERRAFIDLYRGGLSAAERGSIPDLPSQELVRELVRRKVRELAERGTARRSADRDLLERLSDRLAADERDGASY